MENLTRVFFVVDSENDNEEIYETLEEAQKQYNTLKEFVGVEMVKNPRLFIAIVKNAFIETGSKDWNYSDQSNTFTHVKTLS